MRKIGLILLVLLASALLMEAALRLFGYVSMSLKRAGSPPVASGNRRILCIGDCMVLGAGGRSFPEQMQDILLEQYGVNAFSVINAGKASGNSSHMLAALPEAMGKYRPDLVIIMTGRNNTWNPFREDAPDSDAPFLARHSRMYRFLKFLTHKDERIGPERGVLSARLASLETEERNVFPRFSELSAKARARLVSYYCASAQMFYNLSDYLSASAELDKAMACAKGGGYSVVREIIRMSIICRAPDKALVLLRSAAFPSSDRALEKFYYAQAYELQGDAVKADRLLREAVRLDPYNWEYHFELGRLHDWDTKKALAYYSEAKRLSPRVPHPYYAMGLLFIRTKNLHEAEAEFKQALRLDPANVNPLRRLAELNLKRKTPERFLALWKEIPELSQFPEYNGLRVSVQDGRFLRRTPKEEWVSDISEAVTMVRRAGVPVIVSSYHELNLEGMRDAAETNGAIYVDLEPVFKQRFKTRQEYTAYDNVHCNTRGYRAIAEVFAGMAEDLFGLTKSTSAASSPAVR